MRVVAYIDGFNFYHAIEACGLHHLKWVNLRSLCRQFAPTPQYQLTEIYYFSAYATWRPDAYARHREYVKALEAVGVRPVMGRFKSKYRTCFSCKKRWEDHEEKETDVNIGLFLVAGAFEDRYDRALLITGDSDISPAVRLVRTKFPEKQLRILAPIGRGYSMDLVKAAGGPKFATKIQRIHLERALFPPQVHDETGRIVATRPAKYAPPTPPD
jgi:uncharacterized LabA/DUF88 family protein